MSDQQSIVNPPSDESEIVRDEEVVHEAYGEGKVTPEEAKDMDEIKDLQEAAEKVELQNNLEKSPDIPAGKPAEEVPAEIIRPEEKQDKDNQDDIPVIVSAETSKETTKETSQEKMAESLKETKGGL